MYDLTITRILSVHHTHTDCWAMPKPVHRQNSGVVYLTEGSITYHFDGGDETAQAGSILVFPKGLHYCGEKNTQSQSFYVIDFETLPDQALEELRLPLISKGGKWVGHLFEESAGVWSTGGLTAAMRCKELLYAILSGLTEAMARGSKRSELIEEILLYIRRNFVQSDLGVERLGRVFHISASQLRRLFHRELGIQPLQYILNLRMELAQNLLRHECLSVQETAARCGFSSDAYFSRLFKKRTGLSPSAFRQGGPAVCTE